ncbi:phosphoribosylglycinamide formyltransferase [Chloroflexota bacterium]
MYRLGWFSTGKGEGSRQLFLTVWEAIQSGELEAEIPFIFINRELGEAEGSDRFLELVRSRNLPTVCVSSQRFKERFDKERWRHEFEQEAMSRLAGFRPDLSVLAGYMLIVGSEMCRRYTMLNLHPAAPGGPTGTWQQVIRKLIDEGARESGVMMHLVTPELDTGPPATYCTFPIRGGPFEGHWGDLDNPDERDRLFRLIRQEGMKREMPLIVATLKAFAQGKVRIEGEKVVSAGGQVLKGLDLTAEIDKAVKG